MNKKKLKQKKNYNFKFLFFFEKSNLILCKFHYLLAARTIKDSTEQIKKELCTPINISVVLTSLQPVCVVVHWACGHRQSNGEWSYVNLSSLEQLNKEKEQLFLPDELNEFRITYNAYDTR